MAGLWCAVLGAALPRAAAMQTWSSIGSRSMAQAGIMDQRSLGGVQSAADSAARRGPRARRAAAAAIGRAAWRRSSRSGLFVVLGLSALGLFGWLFDPAYRVVGRVINVLVGAPA